MTRIKDLHKKWMKNPEYRKEYDALEEEFALAAEVAKARSRAGDRILKGAKPADLPVEQ